MRSPPMFVSSGRNIESPRKIEILNRLGEDAGRPIPMGIRVNPEVAVETPHPYTRTGEKSARFGIPYDQVVPLVHRIKSLSGVRLISLGMHIGSQVTDSEPYAKGAERLVALTKQVREGPAVSRERRRRSGRVLWGWTVG